MDGLAAVTARVQQIQGIVQSMGGTRPVVSVTSAATLATTGSMTGSMTGSRTGSTPGSTGVTGSGAGGSVALGGAQSFDAVLAQAKAATARSGSVATSAVNADGVPLDLLRYGNGKVPADALQPIGVGSHRLWAPAADAFTRLRAAAKADGVTIGVTDSYRSYEAQVDVARRKGLYKEGGLAAVPGTSDHGWGLSLDLKLDDKAQTWMRANAGRFGFDENTPREPWHWTFQP